jgi:carbon starvation protein
VICLLLAVWGGKWVFETPGLARFFGLRDLTLAWAIILYGLAASTLPVWLLLAPRGYLSTFMKLGTIFALAAGLFLVLPALKMPALSRFVDGSGLVVAGKIFPFCFITIACGAISGFHTLIASGTTPKMLTRESYARAVGYGAMCLESLVAIMALIAACTLEPGVYLSMNVKGPASVTVAQVSALGFPVTAEQMNHLAGQLGEKSLFGRTGGAATLAVGMAQIFSKAVRGRGLDLWYHFAIMFEALFILTTIDAGTRVGRYLLQDILGQIAKPLGQTGNIGANLLASLLIVSGWGCFLIQGVVDPLGGINSLWPLFGIANQMLAAIALCLATTILLKMQLVEGRRPKAEGRRSKDEGSTPHSALCTPHSALGGRPALALITLAPLAWLLAATMTAGVEKIWHPDARIGFLAQARALDEKRPSLEQAAAAAKAGGDAAAIAAAGKAVHDLRVLRFNNLLDAVVAGVFLALVSAIVLLSVREWALLLTRRKAAALRESQPVWLPGYAVAQGKPAPVLGLLALGAGLARELSGEAQMDRAQEAAALCQCDHGDQGRLAAKDQVLARNIEERGRRNPKDQVRTREIEQRVYLEMTEHRFKGVRRCC